MKVKTWNDTKVREPSTKHLIICDKVMKYDYETFINTLGLLLTHIRLITS